MKPTDEELEASAQIVKAWAHVAGAIKKDEMAADLSHAAALLRACKGPVGMLDMIVRLTEERDALSARVAELESEREFTSDIANLAYEAQAQGARADGALEQAAALMDEWADEAQASMDASDPSNFNLAREVERDVCREAAQKIRVMKGGAT